MPKKLVGSKQQALLDSKTRIGPHHEPPIILRRRPVTHNLKPQRFVSLHHHDTYSYGDGYGLPEAHVRRIVELNMGAMAITNHGNVDSHSQFEREAIKQGVKPIFGIELYMPTDEGLSGKTQQKYHLTIIARNAVGYKNLVRMVTESWKNHHFEPTVTLASLIKHKEGLIILSGCQGGLLHCATVGGKNIEPEDASYRRGLAVARRFKQLFGKWYFIEVQAFPELEKSCRFNPLGARIARTIGARLVGTVDAHYTVLEEAEVQKILHNLRGGEKRTIEEMARAWGYNVPLCPPPNDRSIYRRLRATGLSKDEAIEAIVTTEELAQECAVELPKLDMVRYVPMNADERAIFEEHGPKDGSIELWRKWLREGWYFRGYDKLPWRDAAKKQLAHEMALIESKDFVAYFLLVAAGVRHIKEQGIPVGPGRGSVCASVAAYILRITEIDPFRPDYGGMLRFERFIDETREDMPDIDLDFPSSARPMLRAFYEKMLGDGCVNNVGTFTQYKPKNSLDDAARALKIPQWDVDVVKNYLIERANIDLRASSTIMDTAAQFPAAQEIFDKHPDLYKAAWLEGNIKGFGVHAAALILSNEPISNVTSMAEREVPKGSGNIISCVGLDKIDAEYRGMLKVDFLGLNTMSVLQDCIHHPEVNMTLDDLYALPLDDPKIYDAFCADDVVAIFQFDGSATRYVNKAVKPRVFRELCDITSLSRPGALHGGGTNDYIAIKNGSMAPEPLHPAVTELLEMTQHQIVFQEQILRILRVVGDFPWSSVAEIRKIISKKKGNAEFNKRQEQFLEGARRIHLRYDVPPMNDEVAIKIWKRMLTSGQYAFNFSHASAYSLISYYCMHFKVYHPAVFFYASLKHLCDGTEGKRKQADLVRDAIAHAIPVNPLDAIRSRQTWYARRGALRPGFEQVEGIGDKVAPVVIVARREAHRAGRTWTGFGDLGSIKGIGPKTVAKCREFALSDDPLGVYKLSRDIEGVKRAINTGELGALPNPTHSGADISDKEGITQEIVWLGTVQKKSRNVRDLFEFHASRNGGEELDPDTVQDPELREWVVMRGVDSTETVSIKITRWDYPKFKDTIMQMKLEQELILVQGYKPRYSSTRQIVAKQLWIIEP
jgi:DNA polymerase III subunit alpha